MKGENSITVLDAAMFKTGDIVSIGSWPRWFYRFHVPMWARKAMQAICAKLGKRIGPQTMIIASVENL